MVPDEEHRNSSDAGESSAVTPRAPTGKRMTLHEEASQYEQVALQVIVSILKDETQPNSLRLKAAADLLNRSRGRPPLADKIPAAASKKVIQEVRWLPPAPNDRSNRIEPEPH